MSKNKVNSNGYKKYFTNNKSPQKHFFKKKKIKSKKNIKLEASEHRCKICGSNVMVSSHHIRYRSDGGDDSMGNLIALCFNCHRKVHDGFIKDKVFISGRDFILYHLNMIDPKRYADVIKYLRNKRNEI